MIEKQEKSILRISNILNLTRQEFNIIEKHIFLISLLNFKEKQGFNLNTLKENENVEVVFPATDLKETNRERIKEALDKITSRKIYFGSTDIKYFGFVVPFISAKYDAKDRSYSKIIIKINADCKAHFFELANGYTSLQLEAVLNLKSVHSIRIYELMSMYLNQGEWTVEIDKLKDLLGLDLSKYKSFTQFENKVLIYSQKEIWEHCGIHFEWNIAQKQRKKITALTFTIRTKEKQEKVQVNADIKTTMDYIATLTPKDIAEKSHILMTHYTLSAEQKDYILSDTSIFNEFIRVHAIIENMIERSKPPKDRTKYLAKSLGLDKIKIPFQTIN